MGTETYDLIVLGAGSAARDGANKASREHGAHVAIVESTRWGGSCPNIACRPTKAYLVAAELLHEMQAHAAERGIDVPAPMIDLARTRAWKNSLRRDQDSWVRVLRDAGYGVYPGEASFVDANTVHIGDTMLRAEKVLIATGGRTAVPPIRGIHEVRWLDHISALELTEVPESLLVVGAGPVGLEFAQIFARFGSRVTIVNNGPQIAARADADVANELQAALEDEGIEIISSGSVDSVRAGAAVVSGRTLEVSHVLLASGRVPNVEALNLAEVGVETARGGIVVDGHQRTSVAGIWAAGDVAVGPAFTPTAQYQARIAVDDMYGANGTRTADYTVLPTAIFTDPELGAVGMTEAEAREQGHDVGVATHSLGAVTRAQYYGALRGVFKIVYDRTTRRVVGVHILCRGASDIVGSLAVALGLGATVEDLAAVHHVYPSFSEGLKAAAEQAA
jgi:pyruvate/2-oxoglutarate dehydrogenase complex dihydrolipoamide dehydrogenase (E3) component